jgi:hypothetical protein
MLSLMQYRLLGRYFLDQNDDRVSWIRVFAGEQRIMMGQGVYRDDVLILLYPKQVDTITDLEGVMRELNLDALHDWDKTRYLLHMGNANQGYPVQEAISLPDGQPLGQEELEQVVARIEDVF